LNKFNHKQTIRELWSLTATQISLPKSRILEMNLWIGSEDPVRLYVDFAISVTTSKMFFGKRMFLFFGQEYFLSALKQLGFQTFDSVVDESYDSIENPQQRFLAVIEQMKYLATQDHRLILEKVQPIVDHNYNRLLQFKQEIENQQENLLKKYIPREFYK
jgi:hypothetical protein